MNATAQPRLWFASGQFFLTIFASAFLLFWIQFILGKFILPWFGGTPAVWTTCMLFFQLLLLAGYVYAHLLTANLTDRAQAQVHTLVLLLSMGLLGFLATRSESPITPAAAWKPLAETDPVLRILAVLALCAGLPYFALSATGPLLQAWYQRISGSGSPYRLYAVSNSGSFLALLAFPLVFEPRLSLKTQSWLWAAGYVLFALGCCACAFRAAAAAKEAGKSLPGFPAPVQQQPPASFPRFRDLALWFALAAAPSTVFLATTNQLCQDIAVVPLLWILPLGVYLFSFILCFEHPRWYVRNWFHATFPLALAGATFLVYNGALGRIAVQIGLYLAVLFSVCMVCHGELARGKPEPRRLTSFYLAVAAGGACGGIFVGALAPLLFKFFWEYQLGLFAACACFLLILAGDEGSWLYRAPAPVPILLPAAAALLPEAVMLAVAPSRRLSGHLALAVAAIVILFVFLNRKRSAPVPSRKKAVALCSLAAGALVAAVFAGSGLASNQRAIARFRNFYGALAVIPRPGDQETAALTLAHGRIVHGFQLQSPAYRGVPTAYYALGSGLDLAFQQVVASRQSEPRNLRVGLVGLGVGTAAAYARPGDVFRFYEINPQVVDLASRASYFTFLSGARALVEIVPGDARLSLEREAARGERQNFDLLVLDAFSGDSVPVHLLTREAFAIYLGHLREPAGVVAIHITNTYLDLRPVVLAAARHYGLNAAWIEQAGDGRVAYDSEWMLLSFAKLPESPELAGLGAVRPWTDDYSNLLEILRK